MIPAAAPPVILASQSAPRAALLAGAGVRFTAISSGVDEAVIKTALLAQGADAAQIAQRLAEAKALAVSASHPGLVIGADQTLEFEGELFDKAETLDAARDRLRRLRGAQHQLHAGLAVARDGAVIWRRTETARLTMRDFSDGFLEAYLDRHGEAALASVGCYELESAGIQLFSAVDGDYFAILGLPLIDLLTFLRQAGALTS